MTLKEELKGIRADENIAIGAGSAYCFIGKAKSLSARLPAIRRDYAEAQERAGLRRTDILDAEVRDEFTREWPGEPRILCVICEGRLTGALETWREATNPGAPPPRVRISNAAGFYALRKGIIGQAIKDYERGAPHWRTKTDKELEDFFKSDYGETISGADGDKVIEVCKVRAFYGLWRGKMGCPKCKKKEYAECVHRGGTHFTAFERQELECPRAQEELKEERRKKMQINEAEMLDQILYLFTKEQVESNDIYFTVVNGEAKLVAYPQIDEDE